MIKVGGIIGAFNTIFLIFFTAITGVFFARLGGINALRSGFQQIIKNKVPIYEIISGAALAFAALLLIIPGFLTDLIGFLLIIPPTRKIVIRVVSTKFKKKEVNEDFIEGEFEETKNDKEENSQWIIKYYQNL